MPFYRVKPDKFENEQPLTDLMKALELLCENHYRVSVRLVQGYAARDGWIQTAVYCGPYDSYNHSRYYSVSVELFRQLTQEGYVEGVLHLGYTDQHVFQVTKHGSSVYWEYWGAKQEKKRKAELAKNEAEEEAKWVAQGTIPPKSP